MTVLLTQLSVQPMLRVMAVVQIAVLLIATEHYAISRMHRGAGQAAVAALDVKG